MTTLNWDFVGNDKISGPARAGSAALRRLRGDLSALGNTGDRAANPLRQLISGAWRAQGGIQGANASASGLLSTLGQVGGVMGRIGGTAMGITASAAGMAVAFGGVAAHIIRGAAEMVRFRESAIITLGTLMRPQGSGREMIRRTGAVAFRQTQAIARMTPADEAGALRADQQIAAGGFRGAERERVMAASLDVAALNPNDVTAQERFVRALSQIRGRGKLQGEELNQLGELGIGRQPIFAELARQRGITGTEAQVTARIEGLMRSGSITSAQGIAAAQTALSSMTGEGLGGFARLQGQSLGGSISNLEGSVSGLVTGIAGLENLPGVRAFAASLNAIGNALNGSSASGRRFQAAIADIMDQGGRAFGALFSEANVEGFFGTVARVLPDIVSAFQMFSGTFMTGLRAGLGPLMQMFSGAGQDREGTLAFVAMVAEGLGTIVGFAIRVTVAFAAIGAGLVALVPTAMAALDFINGLPQRIGAGFISVGTAMVTGITTGLRGAWTGLTDELTRLASGLPGPVRTALGIHSPSRVFAELGRQLPAGMEMGMDFGMRDVERAGERLAASSVAGATGAGAGAGRGGPLAVVHITVERGDGGEDELVERLAVRLEDLFGDLFDRAALGTG